MSGISSLTAIGNGLAANDGTGDALRSGAAKINDNNAAIVTAVNNLAASQAAGRISYLTKADMDADLAHNDGTMADVTNDATTDNNRSYRKSGASGAGSWAVTIDRVTNLSTDLLKRPVSSPRILGKTDASTQGVDDNVFVGGLGTWDASASTKARASWDAFTTLPTVGANSQSLTGSVIDGATPNSAVVLGGRGGYYSYVGALAAVSLTYGGDNRNLHLAGMCLAMHSDLLLDTATSRGSHGAAVGGSYKQISGDYCGSFAGTVHQINGISVAALGGSSIKIGNISDASVVRRGATVGGYMLNMAAGLESVMLGGNTNTLTSGDRAAMVAGELNEIAASHAVTLGGKSNKVTAQYSIAIGGHDAVSDVLCATVQSCGKFVAQGDNQNYRVAARKTFTGVTDFLSVSGGSGVDIYTPPANCTGVIELNITMLRTDTLGDTAAYKLICSFSNVGGTLSVKAQTVTVLHEDNASYNVAAEIVGTGTRVGVRCTTPGSGYTTRWSASGTITMQRSS